MKQANDSGWLPVLWSLRFLVTCVPNLTLSQRFEIAIWSRDVRTGVGTFPAVPISGEVSLDFPLPGLDGPHLHLNLLDALWTNGLEIGRVSFPEFRQNSIDLFDCRLGPTARSYHGNPLVDRRALGGVTIEDWSGLCLGNLASQITLEMEDFLQAMQSSLNMLPLFLGIISSSEGIRIGNDARQQISGSTFS